MEYWRSERGDWFPYEDDGSRGAVYDLVVLDRAIGASGRDLVVQAGGHVGLYPRHLARFFGEVYTFEPYKPNLECFRRNCEGLDLHVYDVALGEECGWTRVSPYQEGRNSGDCRTGGEGEEVAVVSIDSLCLPGCDLIFLDVQGDELSVIRGAARTIQEYSPVLAMEWTGSVWKDSGGLVTLGKLLEGWGYRSIYSGSDRIYVKGSD